MGAALRPITRDGQAHSSGRIDGPAEKRVEGTRCRLQSRRKSCVTHSPLRSGTVLSTFFSFTCVALYFCSTRTRLNLTRCETSSFDEKQEGHSNLPGLKRSLIPSSYHSRCQSKELGVRPQPNTSANVEWLNSIRSARALTAVPLISYSYCRSQYSIYFVQDAIELVKK